MNSKVLKTLEFDKIIDKLVDKADSAAAKEKCAHLKPMNDLGEIQSALMPVGDAVSRLLSCGNISFSGTNDVGSALARLRLGASLSAPELLKIAGLLRTADRLKKYSRSRGDNAPADSLDSMFSALEPCKALVDEIDRCIVSEDEIADTASSKLKSIRRNIGSMNDRVHSQLNKLISQESVRNCLQDTVVTMRNGRFCLPVRAEFKSAVPGMLHDQSQSGSTVFIEPISVVNLNNELKQLLISEQEEIEVILSNLSVEASGYAVSIESDYRVMTELDFIFAKAKLALDYNGSAPILNNEGRIKILKGRHPLLDKKRVVPIDVTLGDSFDLLIITGPNTGGKTVSLKTTGLLTLMAQAGLFIPAFERSEIAVFNDIFADIGDEQSIEQNLSTFSSHMKNIISILNNVDENSLCLFDELCSGTDPTEGAALAISILSDLHARGIRTMATTHYSEIKVYALSEPGVENACCEFDVETLSPTYRLLIGIPGKSNAFAISGKLGLPEYLIDSAKNRLSDSQQSFEDLIADLETSKAIIEKERQEISNYKEKQGRIHDQLERRSKNLEDRADKIIAHANEEAAMILKEAKAYADETIRFYNKNGGADMREMERKRAELREGIAEKEKLSATKKKEEKTPVNGQAPKKLRLGDRVKVLSMNMVGNVHSLPDKNGNLFVQMGILRSSVNINDLVLLGDEDDASKAKKKYERTSSGSIKLSKTASVSSEIKLIGMRQDEAIAALDKYLDDALLAHVNSVRIVHGKGTGALRDAVHKHLKRLSYIDSFHLAEFGEGDAGVTIAEFK